MRYRGRGSVTTVLTILIGAGLWTLATATEAADFTPDQVKAAVKTYLDVKTKEGGGVFPLKDDKTGQTLALEFVDIRPVIRGIEGAGYFVCTDLRVKGEPQKVYDIDFWVKPQGDRLTIAETVVHREPQLIDNQWVQVTRSPQLWWWKVAGEHGGAAVIPPAAAGGTAGEHPAQSAEAFTADQIKAAIRMYIKAKTQADGGVFTLHDDKTGQDLALEFVKIHDPVRKIEGKGYFACTDFRVQGEPQKLYDLDFWLNPEGGTLTVTRTSIHKEPKRVGTEWVEVPRYTFEGDNPVEVR